MLTCVKPQKGAVNRPTHPGVREAEEVEAAHQVVATAQHNLVLVQDHREPVGRPSQLLHVPCDRLLHSV